METDFSLDPQENSETRVHWFGHCRDPSALAAEESLRLFLILNQNGV